jgi:hypothetical protein
MAQEKNASLRMLKKSVLFVRRSSLVSRRSQALIFLLARYASRGTLHGIRFLRWRTFSASC